MWGYGVIVTSLNQHNNVREIGMATFNAVEVAQELSKHQYKVFEYEAFGHIMRRFGVTHLTAKKWVNRCIAQGAVKRSGKVAISLV